MKPAFDRYVEKYLAEGVNTTGIWKNPPNVCPKCGRKVRWDHDPNGDSFAYCAKCDWGTSNAGESYIHPKHPHRRDFFPMKEAKSEEYYRNTDVSDMSPIDAMRAQFPPGARVKTMFHGKGVIDKHFPRSGEIGVRLDDGSRCRYEINDIDVIG